MLYAFGKTGCLYLSPLEDIPGWDGFYSDPTGNALVAWFSTGFDSLENYPSSKGGLRMVLHPGENFFY